MEWEKCSAGKGFGAKIVPNTDAQMAQKPSQNRIQNWIQKRMRKGAPNGVFLGSVLVPFSGPKREEVVLEKVHLA